VVSAREGRKQRRGREKKGLIAVKKGTPSSLRSLARRKKKKKDERGKKDLGTDSLCKREMILKLGSGVNRFHPENGGRGGKKA